MNTGAIAWGDVATWVSALTTLGALIAAGAVVRVELSREARTERLDEERRSAYERSEQADQIAAWHHHFDRYGSAIMVHSGSSLPIYDVGTTLIGPEGSSRLEALRVPVVPPGDHRVPYPPGVVQVDELGDTQGDPGAFVISLAFRDTAGRNWVRNEHGWLEKIGSMRR